MAKKSADRTQLNIEQQAVVAHLNGPLRVGAVAGSGKCVIGSTLVTTTRGVLPISAANGCSVHESVDAETLRRQDAPATWLNMGTSETLCIATRNGYSITVTPEHPLLIWSGVKAEWVAAESLKPGDRVFLLRGHSLSTGTPHVSVDEAYLLGLFFGDARRITNWTNVDWSRGGDYLPPVCFALLEKLYGITASEITTYRKRPPSLSVTHQIRSSRLAARLVELDFELHGSRNKFVPEWLVAATEEERVAFLQGYFDTDGTCGPKEIELVSASRRAAESVHQMLLGLGVVAALRPKKVRGYDHVYWRVFISGLGARAFRERIGFLHEEVKAACLETLCSKSCNTNVETYPVGAMLKSLRPAFQAQGRWNGHRQHLDGVRISDYLADRRSPSAERLRGIVAGIESPTADLLRNLTDYFLDPVATVEPSGHAEVFDFNVPETHSFIANGFVSHNTAALIERAAHLIEHHNVTPRRILLISFSVNARKEMEKRISARLPAVEASQMCRTFHSIGLDIFREEADAKKEWTLDLTRRLWRKTIRECARSMNLKLPAKGEGLTLKSVEHGASMAKTFMAITPKAIRRLGKINPEEKEFAERVFGSNADTFLSLFHMAEDVRETTGVEDMGMMSRFVTFDDMLYSAAMLLRQREVKERWVERWSYMMVDEYQDTNAVQNEIAEALCSKHRNLMAVGDSNQAIYGWRGAHPEQFLAFERTWPGATTIVMDRNYRSGIEIISAANRLIAHMPAGQVIATSMKCERQTRAHVVGNEFADSEAEAEAIAANIKAHHGSGNAWKDQAILVRMNFMTRPIEVALARHAIPYRLVSGESFFRLPEAMILLGYLRIALDRATMEDVEASISNPGRMIGKAHFDLIAAARLAKPDDTWLQVIMGCSASLGYGQREGLGEWCDHIERLRDGQALHLPPYTQLVRLVEDAKIDVWLKGDEDSDSSPQAAIGEFLNFAAGYSTAAELLDMVDKILAHRKQSSHSRNVVSVATVHAAKGAEWPVVYLPQVTSDLFPAPRGDLLEERRLFYVAVTRAQDELWSSYPRRGTGDALYEPSPFFEEAGITIAGEFSPGRKTQPTKVGTQLALI